MRNYSRGQRSPFIQMGGEIWECCQGEMEFFWNSGNSLICEMLTTHTHTHTHTLLKQNMHPWPCDSSVKHRAETWCFRAQAASRSRKSGFSARHQRLSCCHDAVKCCHGNTTDSGWMLMGKPFDSIPQWRTTIHGLRWRIQRTQSLLEQILQHRCRMSDDINQSRLASAV